MVYILSLDTGTRNTAYSLLKGDIDQGVANLIDFGMIRTSKKDGSVRERIDIITACVRKVLDKYEMVNYFVLEDYTEQGLRTGTVYKEMSWLTESLRSLGTQSGCKTVILENKEWKKKTLGINRATKKQVKHFINWKLPETKHLLKGYPDHVFDSVGIGYALWSDLNCTS